MFGTSNDYTPMNPKNSTGSKRAKKGLKIEAKNGGTEIFVLPPLLLQKLGINLANIVIPEETSSNNTVENDTTDIPNCSKNIDQLKQKRSITCAQNEVDIGSSNLQTASLMKKSVFLSPTFTPDVANMPGELEIACAVNYQMTNSNCKENVDSNSMKIEHNITETDLTATNYHHKSEKDLQHIKNLSKKNCKNVADGIDMLLDNSKQEMNTKIMEPVAPSEAQDTENVVMNILEITEAIPTDDHPDEAYSSDSSNNNPELAWLALAENSTTQTNIDLNNKISIISEQILNPSHFKELKYLHNSNSNIPDFFPIPINSLITTNKLADGDNNQNTLACFRGVCGNPNEPQQNCESISKETDSTLQNKYQNTETILIFDDKGVIINTENCNGNVGVDFPVHIVGNESFTLDEEYTVAEEILGKVENPGELNSDCNFDVCVEFNVSDIEKHLEENEEILESFANEITGSDAHAIIENLENSEEVSSKKPREVTVDTDNIACIEFESHPTTNISQLKSNQNQSNENEIVVDKLASPNDYFSINDNNSSTTWNDPTHVTEKVNTTHGSESINGNVLKDDAVIKAINALKRAVYSIPKESKNKYSIDCNAGRNSKNYVKSEGNSALSVSISSIESNKKNTSETNTVQISKYSDQLKNNLENETRALDKNCKKETNLIGKEHDAKDSIHSTNIPYASDKVEEIAMLLRQITRRRSESVKPLCQSIDHKWLHAKCEKTYKPKSKMHIQGVEKPGGSGSVDDNINLNKVRIKTYKKSIKPKQTPECTNKRIVIQDKIDNDLLYTLETSKYDQECVDFCICKDFGSLTCYDDARLYEHIHFLDHKKVHCDSQFLFSMYNEPEIAKSEKIVDKEIEQDSSPTCAFNICWKNLINNDFTEVENPDRIDKVYTEVNNISDFSTNINWNTIIEQNVPDKMIIKSSQRSKHSSEEIEALIRNEIKLSEQIPVCIPICEAGRNIQVQIIKSEGKTVLDQVEHLSEVTTRENPVGTKARSHCIRKNFEMCQLTENGDINRASCSKGENEDNSLRFVKQSSPMVLETNGSTSQMSNEIMAEVCDPEAAIRKIQVEGNLQNKNNKKGKKRRKSSTGITNEPDSLSEGEQPTVKKSAKCGVCQELLTEEQWEEHCDTSHCFIAWRAGEAIDLQDQNLIKKLQIKLKTNSLTCPFCDFINRRVKKFLAHVAECVNRKAHDNSSVDSPNTKRRNNKEETTGSDQIEENLVTCEVCHQNIRDSDWIRHIAREHDYLAWKEGEPSLDLEDEKCIQKHLNIIVQQIGILSCSKCDFSHKNAKSYLEHVHTCEGAKESLNTYGVENKQEMKEHNHKRRRKPKVISVVCAVCSCNVKGSEWIEHIAKEHNYLAWKVGEEPLDVANEDAVRQYLSDILKENGSLICHKCGYSRKNVKTFYNHTKKCVMQMTFNTSFKRLDTDKFQVSSTPESDNRDISAVNNSNSRDNGLNSSAFEDTIEQCGVCKEKVNSNKWLDHIEQKHEYLAWKEGQKPLDINNEEEVYNHLYCIVKEICRLKCSKCGLERKYVKTYLQHIKTCSAENEGMNASNELIACGVCSEMILANKWKHHAMSKHYNVAWRAGETPLDLNNPLLAEKLMKEYREQNKLVCKICRASRASCLGFYAHILTCGKSDEETEQFKSTCEICSKPYLTIYHRQHMTAHSAQELIREQRKNAELKKEALKNAEPEVEPSSGPRRAAMKARSVIENYKANIGAYSCMSCGYDAGNKSELGAHKCMNSDPFSDSEESARIGSDGDSSESEVDSYVSEAEQNQVRKRRSNKTVPVRMQKLPFSVKHPTTYVTENSRAYFNFHFTDDNLFPDLYNLRLESVSEMELSKYMPPLEESCKVRFGTDWETYKRFEAKHNSGYSFFTGASIQCISWVPSISDDTPGGQFLSIACHNGVDMPRLEVDETLTSPGLIQIWSFRKFKSTPQFVFGLAHDFGTVWAIDWCPSGAQDVSSQVARLGLLALASSNGSAYVFSVPNPCVIEKQDTLIYKMEPILEMRLSTMPDKKYQATSINWSPQKGHSVIVVGYGDGTVAYYDLHNESPLLRTKENNITVLYPYHDERPHNCCVMDVVAYPSMDPIAPMGAVCSVGPTGCEMSSRVSVWPARVRTRIPASGVSFTPLWPIATLSGDDAFVNTGLSELHWWGGNKRVLCTVSNAGCVHCAKVASFSLPLLRISLQHPAFEEPKKITVGSIQMVRLGKKRKQKVNDDLTVKLEPVTYDDAITKYGIEFALDSSLTSITHNFREVYPERFPLADVKSMAFCRSATYHSRLAVATHAGVVFVVTV